MTNVIYTPYLIPLEILKKCGEVGIYGRHGKVHKYI
jgi:hypothetical protein